MATMEDTSRSSTSDRGGKINKENTALIEKDETAAAAESLKKKSTMIQPSASHQQQQQRRVLLPALNPSRKLRTTTTATASASALTVDDNATHSSSSMLTSSTTSNASLRTNSTTGSSISSTIRRQHQQQRDLTVHEDDNTLNSIGNETYLSINTAGQPSARVLRYGETVESLFCLDSHNHNSNNDDDDGGGGDNNRRHHYHGVDKTRHEQLCQQICHGELANNAKAWCEALVMTLQVNHWNVTVTTTAGTNNMELGKRLIQLLRRATSRFKLVKRQSSNQQVKEEEEEEEEVLKLWLLYALVLLKYSNADEKDEEDGNNLRKNDAVQTYRHIQRLRFGNTTATSSSGGSGTVGVGSSTTTTTENFYSSLLINNNPNSSTNVTTTVEEVVHSLQATMGNPDTSLIDIFHTQLKQLEQCYRRCNENDVKLTIPPIATSATASASASTNATVASGGGARVTLPTLKGKKRSNQFQSQRDQTMSSTIDNNKHKTEDDNGNAEDTFDLKLKTARIKLEEGLKKGINSDATKTNAKKRSILKSSSDRGSSSSSSSAKPFVSRKKPRGGSGKLGAILSQTREDDNDDEDDSEKNHNVDNHNNSISPKEHELFQDNISPIEVEPSTSIKDMDLDYLLSWDPTKRGSGGIVVSRQKKKTKVELADEDAKQPVKKITRNDLGYMLNWEPFADRQKKEDESVDGSCSSSNSKADAPPKRSALASTQGMSTIEEGTEGSIEGKEENLLKSSQTTAAKSTKEGSNDVKEGLEISRASSINISGSDNQTDTSEKMIPTSQLDCSFLPLIENKNIIRVDGEPYAKLGVIGKGGSCKVYRALSTECDVVALKKVKLDGLNKQAIDGYANEIALLKRLKGNPAIIQLYSAEVDYERKSILLVMELGEVDLNYVLRQQELLSSKQKSGPGRSSLNMNFIRLTWQQMLTAVHSIHEERIIHSDLKPANFLFVRGALKLIDFGIAKAIEREDTTNVYRETLSGTLSYMSPEAIMDTSTNAKGVRVNKCGRPSDIWSLGCILYQMVYGKTPFADCHGIPQKVLAITNVNHEIPFPGGVDESAIDAMKLCLQRNPKLRPPIVGKNGLLNDHCFLHGKTKF
jgi:serine/threonine-protein kinase TTK/MPS1